MTPLATPRRIRRHRKLAVAFAVVTATTIGTADALVSAPFSQPGSASFVPPAEPAPASSTGNPLRLPDARDVLPTELFDAPTVSDPAIPLPVDVVPPWTPAPDAPSGGPPPAGAQEPPALELPGPADGTDPATAPDDLAAAPVPRTIPAPPIAVVPSLPAPAPTQPTRPPRLGDVVPGPKPQLPPVAPTGPAPIPTTPDCGPIDAVPNDVATVALPACEDALASVAGPVPAAPTISSTAGPVPTTAAPTPRPLTTLTEALR